MKTNELIKLLKKTKRCHLLRHGKRHDIWFSEITQKEFTIPRHGPKEIPNGTVKNILKDAGLE